MRILDDPEGNRGFQDFHEIPWTFMKTIQILEGDHGFQKIPMKIRKINESRDVRVIPQPRARGDSGNSMEFPMELSWEIWKSWKSTKFMGIPYIH